jgi:capsid protein
MELQAMIDKTMNCTCSFRGDKIPAKRYMTATHYKGAGTGRRMSYWGLSPAGPNNSLYSSLNSLRARSRELVRNDPQIDGGMDTLVANIVGTGITPRWQLEDTGLKKEVQELWNDWVAKPLHLEGLAY